MHEYESSLAFLKNMSLQTLIFFTRLKKHFSRECERFCRGEPFCFSFNLTFRLYCLVLEKNWSLSPRRYFNNIFIITKKRLPFRNTGRPPPERGRKFHHATVSCSVSPPLLWRKLSTCRQKRKEATKEWKRCIWKNDHGTFVSALPSWDSSKLAQYCKVV